MAGIDVYTVVVSHFDGSNGATSYTDPIAGALTFTGTAQLSTAQQKFGTASLLLDGNSDYVSVPTSSSLEFGSSDFTVDLWVRFNSVSGFQALFAKFNSPPYRAIQTYLDGSGNIVFRYSTDGTSMINAVSTAWSPSTGTWYHLAFVRSGTSAYLFVNGSQIGSTGTIGTIKDSTANLTIGIDQVGSTGYLNGYVDEFRVSNGVARWTSSFTPPTEAYSTDSTGSMTCMKGYW